MVSLRDVLYLADLPDKLIVCALHFQQYSHTDRQAYHSAHNSTNGNRHTNTVSKSREKPPEKDYRHRNGEAELTPPELLHLKEFVRSLKQVLRLPVTAGEMIDVEVEQNLDEHQ